MQLFKETDQVVFKVKKAPTVLKETMNLIETKNNKKQQKNLINIRFLQLRKLGLENYREFNYNMKI